jgi:hypothetical protein
MGGVVSSVTKPVMDTVSNVPIVGTALGGLGIGNKAKSKVAQANERYIDPEAFKLHTGAGGVGQIQWGLHNLGSIADRRRIALQKQADTRREQFGGSLGNQNQSRQAQLRFQQSLERQAAGQGPSLAQAQLKSAQDRSLRQQMAAASTMRGGPVGAQQRQLMRQQSTAQADLAQQATQARMAEQLQAQQLLGSANEQMRAGDLASSQQLLGARQLEEELANKQFQLSMAAPELALKFGQADQAARADLERLRTNQYTGLAGANLQAQSSAQAAQAAKEGGMLSGLMSAGGAIGAAALPLMSDERTKKAKPADESFVKKKTSEIASAFSKKTKSATKNIKEHKRTNAKNADASRKKLGNALGDAGSQLGKGIASGADAAKQEYEKAAQAGADLHKKSLAAMSDEKTKQKDSDFTPKKFLDAIKPYSFEYKDEYKNMPGAGREKYLGIMAQDLEKSGAVGKSMVHHSPEGIKQVDFGKGFGAILASQAHLNKRLEAIEKKRKK